MKTKNSQSRNGFYKNKYFIAYYDKDQMLCNMFDNIKEICEYKGKEINTTNMNLTSVELYRALKREDHMTRMLTGEEMYVYLIDVEE